MKIEVLSMLISLIGTSIGTIAGILASNKLTNYRISILEEKVDKHNNLIDRMYKLENRVTIIEDNNKKND